MALVKTGAPSDYDAWALSFGLDPATTGAPGADPDGDGMSNQAEYIFGLLPTNGSSLSPITSPLNPTTGTFTYTRRRPALTGHLHEVMTATSAYPWTVDASATQELLSTVNEIETVRVTLTPSLLSARALMARIKASPEQP